MERRNRPVLRRVKASLAVLDPKIRAAARAIAHDATLYLGKNPPQHGIVITGYDHSIKRNAVHKVKEGALDIIHVAVAIHMLAVNIGDDRKYGREFQERPVALVGFGD